MKTRDNNYFIFTTLQFVRELLSQIRFYTANIPNDILSNNEWDKMRKDFSEIDMFMSKAQGKIVNGKDNENE